MESDENPLSPPTPAYGRDFPEFSRLSGFFHSFHTLYDYDYNQYVYKRRNRVRFCRNVRGRRIRADTRARAYEMAERFQQMFRAAAPPATCPVNLWHPLSPPIALFNRLTAARIHRYGLSARISILPVARRSHNTAQTRRNSGKNPNSVLGDKRIRLGRARVFDTQRLRRNPRLSLRPL